MKNKDPFQGFAPAILKIYRRDKEAFWVAVMAPFLANQVSLLDWWHHLKEDVEFLTAFRGWTWKRNASCGSSAHPTVST